MDNRSRCRRSGRGVLVARRTSRSGCGARAGVWGRGGMFRAGLMTLQEVPQRKSLIYSNYPATILSNVSASWILGTYITSDTSYKPSLSRMSSKRWLLCLSSLISFRLHCTGRIGRLLYTLDGVMRSVK